MLKSAWLSPKAEKPENDRLVPKKNSGTCVPLFSRFVIF
jgi:hypothetical protein